MTRERVALIILIIIALLGLAYVARTLSTTPQQNNTRHVSPLVEGLLAPISMALLPDGSIAVAEAGTGDNDNSAGVSLITPDGRIGRLISGLPSTTDAGDLAGVSLVALSPDHETLYIGNFEQRHLWTLPIPEEGLTLPPKPLTPDQLTPAFRKLNNVWLVNPFDMTFDETGQPIVTDASGNGVAKANPDGTVRFIHRFARLPDPRPGKEKSSIDSVPTGITRVDNEYFITLTGGCPYPEGAGQLVAIDEERNQRTVLTGLNMPIDIAPGPADSLWLLEFAQFTPDASCFTSTGYQPNTGRLSRLTPSPDRPGEFRRVTILDNLNYPGAVLPLPDGSLYISEVFPGRILHVTFDNSQVLQQRQLPKTPPQASHIGASREPPTDPTQLENQLRQVVDRYNFEPYPGLTQREQDTPLTRLGQALFFDPLLSGDQNIACATCHHPTLAMADGRALPIGTGGIGLGPHRQFSQTIALGPEATTISESPLQNPFEGQFVPRNSPTIINSALYPNQFWDGRVAQYSPTQPVHTPETALNRLPFSDSLTAQALFPLISTHEMAGATLGERPPMEIRAALINRLRQVPEYEQQFRAAFNDETALTPLFSQVRQILAYQRLFTTLTMEELFTPLHVAQALAAFQKQFIYTAAPWDDYLSGQQAALSEQQKQGALLFFGELNPAVNCAQCHQGDLLSDFAFHNLLAPQLGPGKGHGYSHREDWGRARVTFDWRDRYAFRTPSLRNVALTAPYFHSGAYTTLTATIRHHAAPITETTQYDPSRHGVAAALFSSLQPFEPTRQLPTMAPHLRAGLPLTEADIAALVAFLHSLTDPAARELEQFIPQTVPSGLPLDPLPEPVPLNQTITADETEIADSAPAAAPSSTTPQFRDVAAAVGLDFQHGAFQTAVFQDPVAAMGGGLCWLDYDRDGWLDLYVINSHAEAERDIWGADLPRNRLYRNQGGQFQQVDTAALSMRGNGCVAADFNRDGWVDLYVTADGPNALLWNNGDGTFSEGAAMAGVAAPEWNSAAVVGDLNGDEWPDLFVAAYLDLNQTIPKPTGAFPQDYYGLPDRLYINQGPDEQGLVSFAEVATAVGLQRQERGLGAHLSDFDQDGDLDLYIANDGHPNRLYRNEPQTGFPGLRFVDLTETAQVGDAGSGMGVAVGDYDADGWDDLFITNWERELNALYRNEVGEKGALVFQYSTFRIGLMGLGRGMTGWGTHLLDIDHDTDLDLLIINGRVPVTNLQTDAELVRLYRNRTIHHGQAGRRGHFLEATEQAGLKAVGPLLGRGSAVADYDNDGDLDIAIATIGGPLTLLENEMPPDSAANWLVVSVPAAMPGTTLWATLPNGQVLRRELHRGSSYLASEDPRFHLGLGAAQSVTRLKIQWPGGIVQFEDVAANQIFRVTPEA